MEPMMCQHKQTARDRLAVLQIPRPFIALNWLLLLALLWFSYLGFMIFALLLAMNCNGTKKAAMLMARQAYIVERSARMHQVSPQVYTFHTVETLILINL
jgi:hypothetical protein